MKKLMLLFFSLCSFSVSAYYPTYVSRTDHLTEISYKSSGLWDSTVINSSLAGKPLHDEVKSAFNSINSELFNYVESAAREEINDLPTLRFRELKYAKFVGPLKTKIMTSGDGVITTEVSGFNFSSEVKVEFTLFTLYGKVNTSELKFAADYDVITGRVYNLRDIGNIQVSLDVDGNGIINSAVAEVLEALVNIFTPNFIQESVDESLDQLIEKEYYIAGLDSVIPEGVWVIDNIDIGMKIKDAIRGVKAGEYIDIALTEWEQRYYEGSKYRYYYRNRVQIDISNNYKFDYGNEPVFATGDWINPCAGPGGSSSGCYEP